jgi:hypothetical protein
LEWRFDSILPIYNLIAALRVAGGDRAGPDRADLLDRDTAMVRLGTLDDLAEISDHMDYDLSPYAISTPHIYVQGRR